MLRIRIAASVSRDADNPSGVRTKNNGNFVQYLEVRGGGKTSAAITSVAKDNLVYIEYD